MGNQEEGNRFLFKTREMPNFIFFLQLKSKNKKQNTLLFQAWDSILFIVITVT